MASYHNVFLLSAFLIAFSLSFCRTTSGARILLTTSSEHPTEISLFKEIPGHGKHKFFKKPPFDPKSKFHHHPKFKIPAHAHPTKPVPGGHKVIIPKVVPKPIFKHDPPKFKIPPKHIIKAAAAEKSDKSLDDASKFSAGTTPYSGLPNFGLPPLLSSPSIPYPDFIPLVPAIPLTPQSDDSKVKSTTTSASPTTSP